MFCPYTTHYLCLYICFVMGVCVCLHGLETRVRGTRGRTQERTASFLSEVPGRGPAKVYTTAAGFPSGHPLMGPAMASRFCMYQCSVRCTAIHHVR